MKNFKTWNIFIKTVRKILIEETILMNALELTKSIFPKKAA